MNDTGFFSDGSVHIGGCMDCRFRLLAIAIGLAFAGSVHAGFAQVSPPSSISRVGTQTMMRVAANAESFAGGVRGAAGVINVGGRAVSMPAAYRFAANAPRVAAAFGFTPAGIAIVVAAGAASALYAYYKSGGFELVDGVWQKNEMVDGQLYSVGSYEIWMPSKSAACDAIKPWLTQTNGAGVSVWVSGDMCVASQSNNNGTFNLGSNSFQTKTGKVPKPRPVTGDEFEDDMAAKPLPAGVPQALPIPLPVEDAPILNPSPRRQVDPDTEPAPTPQPLRVPQGEPQLVPSSDPAQYKTPVVDIVPSPTVDDPWRVDVQPKDVIKSDPSPVVQGTPNATQNTGEKATEKTPGLCDLYPDILACAKPEFDTPDSDELGKKEVQVTLTPDSGWGGGGSCPAPRHLHGANVDFEFTGFCNFMTGLRPVVLAMAWLAAAFILLGFKGGSD